MARFSECDEVDRGVIQQGDFHETRPTWGPTWSIHSHAPFSYIGLPSCFRLVLRFGIEFRQEPKLHRKVACC